LVQGAARETPLHCVEDAENGFAVLAVPRLKKHLSQVLKNLNKGECRGQMQPQ